MYAHRARRASRRAARRAGRQRVDQDRSGPRHHRSRRLSSVRGAARVPSSSTRPTRSSRGAERAAQDARRAAVLVDVHARDVAAGHAACRPCGRGARACASGRSAPTMWPRRSMQRGTERSRGARHCGDGRWQPRAGARSQRAAISSKRARSRSACSRTPRRATIRGVGSKAPRICCRRPAPAAQAIGINWRRICAPWRRCCATSSSCQPRGCHLRPRLPTPTCGVRARSELHGCRPTGASVASAPSPAIEQALVALDRNAGVKIVADWLVLQL